MVRQGEGEEGLHIQEKMKTISAFSKFSISDIRMAGAAPPSVYDDLILHISPDKVLASYGESCHVIVVCSSSWSRSLPHSRSW